MKALVVGDTHCNVSFANSVAGYASATKIDCVIQVGDFGYDFHPSFIRVWTDWLDKDEARSMYWLDGNHDNHDYIREEILPEEDNRYPIPHWHEHMYYCPRGSTERLGSSKVQFLGGAYSIDRHRRRLGESWWEGELTSDEDVRRAIQQGTNIDILFTHDCPETVWFEDALKDGGYKVDPISAENRARITEVVRAVSPREVIHGHYHTAYSTHMTTAKGGCEVTGLGADHIRTGSGHRDAYPVDGDNVLIIDL